MIFQRAFMAVWLVAGLVMLFIARDYQAPFSYEPVGPRAYPMLMFGLMSLGLAYLIIRPTPIGDGEDQKPLDASSLRKVAACCAILLGYALTFQPLGFPLSAFITATLCGLLYGGRLMPCALVSLLLAIGLYVLFDRVMEVPLPLGVLEFLEG